MAGGLQLDFPLMDEPHVVPQCDPRSILLAAVLLFAEIFLLEVQPSLAVVPPLRAVIAFSLSPKLLVLPLQTPVTCLLDLDLPGSSRELFSQPSCLSQNVTQLLCIRGVVLLGRGHSDGVGLERLVEGVAAIVHALKMIMENIYTDNYTVSAVI